MRSARSEMLSLVTTLSIPAAVFCILPYSSFRLPPPAESRAPAPFAAFADLTPDEAAQAMRRAKSTGHGETADAAIRPDDLLLRSLPDDPPTPLVRLSDRTRPPNQARIGWRPPPYLPTRAAPGPATIPSEKDGEAQAPAFSRDDLLRIE